MPITTIPVDHIRFPVTGIKRSQAVNENLFAWPVAIEIPVASPAELDAALSLLELQGIAHSGIKDIGDAFILEFRDPDNIALELYAPKTPE